MTDDNDKIFNGANRGKYIVVAAPGVDVLVPALENTYRLTTSTQGIWHTHQGWTVMAASSVAKAGVQTAAAATKKC